ncbi:hypothetical protein C8R44DRAFT_863226 [Mycena epipterygia]|nr:hypothetical protein C8R44DRAFT_863226 [Mycena epipterygia]
MASPFVYVPEASSSATPYSAAYHNPYYPTPQPGHSPFLPPSPLLYPSSPYLGPSDGAGAASSSPNPFNPNSVLWPDEPQYESPYTTSWIPLQPRQRTNSWQGPAPPPGSPFVPPKAPAFLSAQSSYFRPGHKKSNSWGNTGGQPPSWMNANPYFNNGGLLSPQMPLQIHPWLNGDSPSPVFHFDLAPVAFMPLRLASANPPQSMVLGAAEIREPAFHPPLTTLRILLPKLPFWPIDLALPANVPASQAPPISLGDVLVAMHRAMHMRITHADWATLASEDEQRVTRAFTQRCRAEAVRSGVPPAQLRDREVALRNQGVKRVDFLLGKTVFKGLVRVPGDPEGSTDKYSLGWGAGRGYFPGRLRHVTDILSNISLDRVRINCGGVKFILTNTNNDERSGNGALQFSAPRAHSVSQEIHIHAQRVGRGLLEGYGSFPRPDTSAVGEVVSAFSVSASFRKPEECFSTRCSRRRFVTVWVWRENMVVVEKRKVLMFGSGLITSWHLRAHFNT